VPAGLDQTVTTAHFVVHYTSAAGDPNADTAEHAQALADSGEKAYAAEVGQWGFPAPLDDGDGKTDIYVFAGTQGVARSDPGGEQTSGYISYTPTGHPIHIPHEFFHLIQFGIYKYEGGWLAESTADWAALGVAGGSTGTTLPFAFSKPAISLDCLGTEPTDCGGDRYGYRGNIFFEHVSERYGGPGTIREIFERAAVLGAGNKQRHSLQAVGDVLQAHGTSIESAWNQYALAGAAGQYTLPGLSSKRPALDHTIFPGDGDSVAVDHLAVKYVGLNATGDRCAKAKLRLTITLPAGVAAEPAFVADDGTITPAGAPVDIPWDDCDSAGTLVLPNPSATVDGAQFRIQTAVTFTPTAPPALKLSLRKAVTLAAGKPRLRFKLKSSSAGVAAIALRLRKTVTARKRLRRGSNAIALKLPRGSKAGTYKLVITPISTSGAKGKPLTRKVKISFKRR
jgi:hypothetical protein